MREGAAAEAGEHGDEAGAGEAVVDVFAPLFAADDAGVAQDVEVAGDGGHVSIAVGAEFADAALAVDQEADEEEADGVAEGFEEACVGGDAAEGGGDGGNGVGGLGAAVAGGRVRGVGRGAVHGFRADCIVVWTIVNAFICAGVACGGSRVARRMPCEVAPG